MSSIPGTSGSNPTADSLIVKQKGISRHVLNKLADDFKKEQKFTDLSLVSLYSAFGEVFDRALSLYESSKISKIIAFDANAQGVWKEINSSRWLLEVQGLSGEAYILFPNVNYCPCAAFKYQVLRDQSDQTCKHVLAAWLASLDPSKVTEKHITREQFKNLLLYQVSEK
ncbi:GSCOCG00002336001-RA-CDS [Cotesia congregata]|uniref:Similar to Zswim7: Zinc finger SWIM domain-containing protein 7 (Mus musculus) n=1 Tax=Cotesia congregata TaxID=51543 RepID=A0A8J2HR57_COTCN|nr:GSCOCG00002336001-RA-CDS [Cotesia congregata]CAG5103695.1 Similar to Zswim7: Zinc finger SWIM domain-containing protein 7 (Mus musculus) [Cotesia congregata]